MFSEVAKRLNELRGKAGSWNDIIDTLVGSFGHCRTPLKHHNTVEIDINNKEVDDLQGLGQVGIPDLPEVGDPDDARAALKAVNRAGFFNTDIDLINGAAAVFIGPVLFQDIDVNNKVNAHEGDILVQIFGGAKTTNLYVSNAYVTNLYDENGDPWSGGSFTSFDITADSGGTGTVDTTEEVEIKTDNHFLQTVYAADGTDHEVTIKHNEPYTSTTAAGSGFTIIALQVPKYKGSSTVYPAGDLYFDKAGHCIGYLEPDGTTWHPVIAGAAKPV